jgi:hypothetical protein
LAKNKNSDTLKLSKVIGSVKYRAISTVGAFSVANLVNPNDSSSGRCALGDAVCLLIGCAEGAGDDCAEGCLVGIAEGWLDGMLVRLKDGCARGIDNGVPVGTLEGRTVGPNEGSKDCLELGNTLGSAVG